MKTIWSIITILAIAHMLALMGFVGYLAGTDRLNRDRIDAIRAIFVPTIAEDEAAAEAAEQESNETKSDADPFLLSTDSTAGESGQERPGAGSEDRYERLQTVDDLLRERQLRFEKDREHLKRTLEEENRKLQKGWDELRAEQAAFQQELDRQRSLREDEQFQKMVGILKGLSGKELKGKFDAFLVDGNMDLVIDVLDAFDNRTAQKVMKEYKSDEENVLAAELLRRLKDRGLTLANP